jgi:Family of unknown function (DUF5675)
VETFVLQRMAETPCSTWGELNNSSGEFLAAMLERGACNSSHVRIPAGSYQIERRKFGESHFDAAFRQLIGSSYNGILWLPHVPGRSNIEIHTANRIEELLGCLATGGTIVRDANDDFAIAGGTSKPAYVPVYAALSSAVDAGGAQLVIEDISQRKDSSC